MKKKIVFQLLIFVLFLLSVLLSRELGNIIYKFPVGILLLYYLPGSNLNDIIFLKNSKKITWNTKLALDIASSIAIIYLAYAFFKGRLEYFELRNIVFVFSLNILLFALNIIIHLKTKRSFPTRDFHINKENKRIILLSAIPVGLFLIRLALNPYAFEIDSRQYYEVYKNILYSSYDTSWLAGQRLGFAVFMIFSNYIAGMNFIMFIKFFVPILFLLTSLVLFDLTKMIKNSHLAALAYLLLIGSPYLTIMNEGVRPETFVFVFTLPILFLIYKSISYNKIGHAMLALIFAYVAYRFHEFGMFLLFISILSIIINLIRNRSEIILSIKANPIRFLVILSPYAILLLQNYNLFISISVSQIAQYFKGQYIVFMMHPQWNWWFLNNFINFDGGQIQWPGYSFILYYLYTGPGILIIFLLLSTKIIFYKIKNKKTIVCISNAFWGSLPIIIYFLMYLFMAEVLPRMNIFLYPNRTWAHIAISVTFLIAVELIALQKLDSRETKSKMLVAFFYLTVIGGGIGSTILSTNMGGLVVPSEKGVIKKIKALPEESIIVSNQVNDNIVTIYGNKLYIHISKSQFSQNADFIHEINNNINDYPDNFRKQLLDSFDIRKISQLIIDKKYTTSSYSIDDSRQYSNEEKLAIIKQYDPKAYGYIIEQFKTVENIGEKPIYYLYSFAKFDGFLAQRKSWAESNNPQDLEWLQNYNGDDIAYKDKHAILIKIR